MKNGYKYIILLVIIVGIIIFNVKTKSIEGFENTTQWSPDLIRRFNIYQETVNQNVNQYNLDVLQKQATPEEAEEYLKTGYWPWPEDLKNLYIEAVWSSPLIKSDPHITLDYAMKVYNKNAATQLLAWNTKEGQFLLYGGDLGVSNGMPKNVHNTIKCSGNDVMEKKVYTGMNLWNGYMNSTTTVIKPEDIPKEMPGFSFVKSPCNPCVALSNEFSCPFKLNVKDNSESNDDVISLSWKKLWNLN